MTEGMARWAAIERYLGYKNRDPLLEKEIRPDLTLKDVLMIFCKDAADFIVACEEETERPKRPRFDKRILNYIEDSIQRAKYQNLIGMMNKLIAEFAARPDPNTL
jgi:hypothetical protein